jgi:hypothetical protein
MRRSKCIAEKNGFELEVWVGGFPALQGVMDCDKMNAGEHK